MHAVRLLVALVAAGFVLLGVANLTTIGEEVTRNPYLLSFVNNSGEEGSVIVRELMKTEGNIGYNAATMKTEDLVKAGVIDPAKVTKTAMLNAASIAGLMLITEALVSEIKEDKPEGGMPGGGMPGGMDGMY